MSHKNHQILIIGGGTAGITVAAQLLRKSKGLDVAILEPSEKHYYQPAWTLVAAGTFNYKDTERDEATLIPEGAVWIKDFAEDINPENNSVTTRSGDVITYQFLVVCPGIQIDLDGIEGLRETLGKNGVCSNYTDPNYTWEVLQNFKGGNALFTQPTGPIKCGGAPQKIMYLADEYFVKTGVRDKTNVIFATPGTVIFGVKEFAETLTKVINRKGIILKFYHKLVRIDGPNKKAIYELTATDESNCIVTVNDDNNVIQEDVVGKTTLTIPFELLHLAPPQSAPDFVKKSKITHQDGVNQGWVKVDHYSLQNPDYPNVFALGDVAALPTAKTGAAVRKQAPVVVDNILKLIAHKTADNKSYTGYSSCPLVTGYGKMVLAEFGYGNKRMSDPLISTFVNTTKEQWSMWILKKYGLPFLYWNLMLRGRI